MHSKTQAFLSPIQSTKFLSCPCSLSPPRALFVPYLPALSSSSMPFSASLSALYCTSFCFWQSQTATRAGVPSSFRCLLAGRENTVAVGGCERSLCEFPGVFLYSHMSGARRVRGLTVDRLVAVIAIDYVDKVLRRAMFAQPISFGLQREKKK